MSDNIPGENGKNNSFIFKYTPFHTRNNDYTNEIISLATEAVLLV